MASGSYRYRIQPTRNATQPIKETWVRKIGAIGCAAFLFSVLAQAQIPRGGNVFFGYSYSRGNAFTGNFSPVPTPTMGSINMNGWDASLEGKYLPWLGVVADFDWHYGSRTVTPGCVVPACTNTAPFRLNASRHELMFGPRASVSIGRYTPFAQLLLGVAHQTDSGGGVSNSDTTFATAIGGGLDYKLIKGVAARVQMDSIHTSFFGSGQNNFRFSTGILFRF
jgi:opacity protein-like surface antigen